MKNFIILTLLSLAIPLFGGSIPEEFFIAREFLLEHEGACLHHGKHVLYDDAVPTFIGGKINPNKFIMEGETYAEFKARCKGNPTIGYGSTDAELCKKLSISDAEAQLVLCNTIKKIAAYMPKKFGVVYNTLNKYQRAALISYFYNVGMYSKHPALLKALKNNATTAWTEINAGLKDAEAKHLTGLISRRAAEQLLYQTEI